MDESINVFGEN